MKKFEITIAIISFTAFVLNILLVPFLPHTAIPMYIFFSIASLLYCYLGFAIFNGIPIRNIFKKDAYKGTNPKRIVGAICTGYALSMVILGIFFKVMSFPGAGIMLTVGLACLLVVTAVAMVRYVKTHSQFYIGIFVRIAIIGGLGLLLFLLPPHTLINIKYRNYPEYLEALKNSLDDPRNIELDKIRQMERRKMKGYQEDEAEKEWNKEK